MTRIKKYWAKLLSLFDDERDSQEPFYDPVHLGAMIVLVIFSMGALFWLLWTLLVYGGGLFRKIVPAFQVLFTEKKLSDFGWVGYPFELGVFEGFIANCVALVFLTALIIGIWWMLEPGRKDSKP